MSRFQPIWRHLNGQTGRTREQGLWFRCPWGLAGATVQSSTWVLHHRPPMLNSSVCPRNNITISSSAPKSQSIVCWKRWRSGILVQLPSMLVAYVCNGSLAGLILWATARPGCFRSTLRFSCPHGPFPCRLTSAVMKHCSESLHPSRL